MHPRPGHDHPPGSLHALRDPPGAARRGRTRARRRLLARRAGPVARARGARVGDAHLERPRLVRSPRGAQGRRGASLLAFARASPAAPTQRAGGRRSHRRDGALDRSRRPHPHAGRAQGGGATPGPFHHRSTLARSSPGGDSQPPRQPPGHRGRRRSSRRSTSQLLRSRHRDRAPPRLVGPRPRAARDGPEPLHAEAHLRLVDAAPHTPRAPPGDRRHRRPASRQGRCGRAARAPTARAGELSAPIDAAVSGVALSGGASEAPPGDARLLALAARCRGRRARPPGRCGVRPRPPRARPS
jgi:hypothetical protein